MGENNCSWNRRLTLKRETLLAAQAIYQSNSKEILIFISFTSHKVKSFIT